MHKEPDVHTTMAGGYSLIVKINAVLYDDNNKENLFYFGYTGLGREDIGRNGRFEISYRRN